jgi:MGT family glycosyltransferase
VIALHDTWPFELIVRDTTEIGGLIAAEVLGIPHASVEIGVMPLPRIKPWLSANYNALRADHGLPPDPDMNRYFHYLHLAFVPPSYQDPALAYPATGHAFRHEVFDRSGDEALPDWAAGLPDRPTVYVTLGTFFGAAQHVFRTIIDGLRGEDVNLIITVGRGQDPAALEPLPPNTHVERYIPQSLIFPQCDLVVCHAGWNTVLAALSHSLPLINIPVGADQPQNAARCAALGVGPTILPIELTPQHIRETVQTVLGDPGYRERANALQAEMESLPGTGQAVELLERLAHERQPILAA